MAAKSLPPFPNQTRSSHRWVSALLGLTLTLLVFLTLPLSRMLSGSEPPEKWEVRPMARSLTPPPPPPPPPEKPTETTNAPEPAAPNIERPADTLSLRQLPVALDIRPDRNLLTTSGLRNLADGFGAAEAIQQFTFSDLKGGPRVISIPPVSIPVSLARRGFGRGRVVFSIRINPDGSVDVLETVESTHPELIEPARRSASRARFEPPQVDGRSVPIYGNWPLIIEAM